MNTRKKIYFKRWKHEAGTVPIRRALFLGRTIAADRTFRTRGAAGNGQSLNNFEY